jgi:hypothetical protein
LIAPQAVLDPSHTQTAGHRRADDASQRGGSGYLAGNDRGDAFGRQLTQEVGA